MLEYKSTLGRDLEENKQELQAERGSAAASSSSPAMSATPTPLGPPMSFAPCATSRLSGASSSSRQGSAMPHSAFPSSSSDPAMPHQNEEITNDDNRVVEVELRPVGEAAPSHTHYDASSSPSMEV